MGSVRKSLLAQLANSYLGLVLQVVSAAIIARLLTPTEIGIFSVAAVLMAMAGHFREFGLSEYIIQEKDLTDDKVRAAFAMNLIISWSTSAVLVASSWTVADFYRHAGVGEIMRLQALSFALVPFGAVTNAYFQRTLNYRPILISGICANLVSFAVAIACAFAGLSYMSLAWSSFANVVVSIAVTQWFRPASFPHLPSLRGIGQVASFSKHAMGIYFFGQLGKSAPEAVIGRVLDMASVAFFSRANGLSEIFNRTVLRAALPICLPYFAQAARMGQSTAQGFLKATALLTGVAWPFFAAIGIMAFSTIRLLYGSQWGEATSLAQILTLAALVELPYWLTKEVLIAEGRVELANRLQFITQALRLAGLALVFPFGLSGACWGLVGAALVNAAVAQRDLRQTTQMRFLDLVKVCKSSAWVTLGVALPLISIAWLFPQRESNFLPFLLTCGPLAAALWLAGLWLTRHPFWHELVQLAGSLIDQFKRKHDAEPRL